MDLRKIFSHSLSVSYACGRVLGDVGLVGVRWRDGQTRIRQHLPQGPSNMLWMGDCSQ